MTEKSVSKLKFNLTKYNFRTPLNKYIRRNIKLNLILDCMYPHTVPLNGSRQ